MKILLIGASGAIGSRLVPRLVQRGHEVVGAHRSAASRESVRAMGAEPVELNLLDSEAVHRTVRSARPEAIVHQATALSGIGFARSLDRTFAVTNRLRTEGTRALIHAGGEVGVKHLVAQSFASMRYARVGGPVKTENDPLDPDPVAGTRKTSAAMHELDEAVVAAGGVALRYGGFYGAADDALLEPVRRRRLPIVGDGGGITSFVHLEDAAAATVLAIEMGARGIFNIVDDDPAPFAQWLPWLAHVLGAKRPRRVPPWVARVFAGNAAVVMGTEARGASNAKARSELRWTPRYSSWRDGFVAAYGRSETRALSSTGVRCASEGI